MKNSKIGFWGYPAPETVNRIKQKYPDAEWIDLDMDFGYPDKNILPITCCKIIKNIINNVFYIDPVIIAAPIGKDKCDSGWYTARILKDMGFNVVETKYEQNIHMNDITICTSNLPLREKINTVMNNIITPKEFKLPQTEAKFGFWGVPPNDMSVLELFPNNTHIYGWIRCVEAGMPADIELEMKVDNNVPTVFYAQAFCSKTELAKYLADKYNGLYIDIDDYANNSIKAKIEAFLRLR